MKRIDVEPNHFVVYQKPQHCRLAILNFLKKNKDWKYYPTNCKIKVS